MPIRSPERVAEKVLILLEQRESLVDKTEKMQEKSKSLIVGQNIRKKLSSVI